MRRGTGRKGVGKCSPNATDKRGNAANQESGRCARDVSRPATVLQERACDDDRSLKSFYVSPQPKIMTCIQW
jgi:hypothetical protein